MNFDLPPDDHVICAKNIIHQINTGSFGWIGRMRVDIANNIVRRVDCHSYKIRQALEKARRGLPA